MLPLDSPRWSQLSAACGSATTIPDLLLRMRQERDAPLGGSAWTAGWDWLCHQYTIYSATYAAFSHLADIAASGSSYQRREILLIAGACAVMATEPRDVPEDLRGELATFLAAVRAWSISEVLSEPCDEDAVPYYLQAVAGLRYPDAPCARAVTGLDEEVACTCPVCEGELAVWMRDEGPHALAFDPRGHTIEDFSGQRQADRAAYPARLQRGEAILQTGVDPWPPEHTTDVLAALAERCGLPGLAEELLDLASEVSCPHCGAAWSVESAIQEVR